MFYRLSWRRAAPRRAAQGGRMSTSTNARFSGKLASVVKSQIAAVTPTTPDPLRA
jgi:hypothetical protein